MKTREKIIDVWLDPDHVDQINRGHLSQFNNGIYFSAMAVSGVKAKLIIEIPEKSVTITESDLDYILRYCGCLTDGQIKGHLRQKLFGESK